jgi:hypothetical protein
MAVSVTKQVPPAHDVEFVAGNPFSLTVTSTGATITSPVVTMKTAAGDAYTTDPGIPTVSQASTVTTIAFTAADTAALNTSTRPKAYRWSLQALVNGAGPYELVARNITVHPVGAAIATQSADQVSLDVTVGGVDIALSVALAVAETPAPVVISGTTDTLSAVDNGVTNQYTNNSLVTVTIPTDATEDLVDGFWCGLYAVGAGGLQLSTTGITLVGSPRTEISQDQFMIVVKTATANTWMVVAGGGIDLNEFVSREDATPVAGDGIMYIKDYATARTASMVDLADLADAILVDTPSIEGTPAADDGLRWSTTANGGAGAFIPDPFYETVNTVAAAGSTETIPAPTTATVNRITLSANCTFTFPTATAGAGFVLELVQGASAWTATWPGTVKWASGTPPTLSAGAGEIDVFVFFCSDGTNWNGFICGQDMS